MAKRVRHIDLTSENGPPLTTRELAGIAGVSVRTVQRDIAYGDLNAVRRLGRRQYRIPWEEARLYATRSGVR